MKDFLESTGKKKGDLLDWIASFLYVRTPYICIDELSQNGNARHAVSLKTRLFADECKLYGKSERYGG